MKNNIQSNHRARVVNQQIRLIIPQSLLDDLTFIAKTKFISRLALIRSYLLEKAQHDLILLNEQATQIEDFSSTKKTIQDRLDHLEEVKASKSKRRWEDSY